MTNSNTSNGEYAVRVITTDESWDRNRRFAGADYMERRLAAIAEGDGPCIAFSQTGFVWECPGCGGEWVGVLGPEPVSGWEEPRWRKTGSDEAPTLEPSLGCPQWRNGKCAGHWWLRDGRLVPA